ncbi:MAG: hypothetical protein M0Q42_13490 [Xanthomonadales bacterium]|nr:hypothetical protein [Xanthomonadales bacterium]
MFIKPSHPALTRLAAVAALALVAVAPVLADKPGTLVQQRGGAPAVQVISGAPLTVNVGDEHSYQIFNDQIPGVGQIYPSGSTGTADMGWMVHADGILYSPDFSNHSSGSATGSLGSRTPYSGRSISAVSGSGSGADPFQVTVQNQLGGSGLESSEVIRYVNGENYFTKHFTLTNTSADTKTVNIYLAGDIYLAGADSGVPYREAASGSIGGSDCGSPASYYILYIPQTPADAWTGAGYGSVWSQIRDGTLDSALSTTSCIDNGAGLQWNRSLAPGASTTIQAATSFGDIPSIVLFDLFNVTPDDGAQGSTVNVTIAGLGFASGMQLDFGSGITLADLVVIDANTATATLTIAPAATVGPRDVVGTSADGATSATLTAGFRVTGAGTPPPPGPTQPVPSLGATSLIVLLLGMLVVGLVSLRRFG